MGTEIFFSTNRKLIKEQESDFRKGQTEIRSQKVYQTPKERRIRLEEEQNSDDNSQLIKRFNNNFFNSMNKDENINSFNNLDFVKDGSLQDLEDLITGYDQCN